MMGMSSLEWSRYMHDRLGVPDSPEEINAEVVRLMLDRYREQLPLLPGATEAVERIAARWPLGLASSSNRELIEEALAAAGIDGLFRVTVSSEEVARGKPAPDVYVEAARRLDVDAGRGPPRSRTRTTASCRPARRECASSPSRTRTSHPVRRRWPRQTSCSGRWTS